MLLTPESKRTPDAARESDLMFRVISNVLPATFLTAFVISPSPTVSAAEQPHVVLVITDDRGYSDPSCHGNPGLKTPNIDQPFREHPLDA